MRLSTKSERPPAPGWRLSRFQQQGRGLGPDVIGRQSQHGPAGPALANSAQKTAHHGPEGRVQGLAQGAAADEFHKKAARPGPGQRADKRPQAEKQGRQQNSPGDGPDHARKGTRRAGAVAPGLNDLQAHFKSLSGQGNAHHEHPEPDVHGLGRRVDQLPQGYQPQQQPVGRQAKDVEQQYKAEQRDKRARQD